MIERFSVMLLCLLLVSEIGLFCISWANFGHMLYAVIACHAMHVLFTAEHVCVHMDVPCVCV